MSPLCGIACLAFGYCTSLRGYIPDMIQGEYVLPFPDRRTAGTLLAERLTRSVSCDNWAERTVVLALPRGGVAVAKQVAIVLGVPLSVIVTRKIGYPRQPELGVGAIAEGLGTAIYDVGLLGTAVAFPGRPGPGGRRPAGRTGQAGTGLPGRPPAAAGGRMVRDRGG